MPLLYLFDLIDYWRDALDRAVDAHDLTRVMQCGKMLHSLTMIKEETYKLGW